MTIVLVDDHPPMLAGVAAIIERQTGFNVIGTAGGYDEGLKLIGEERPDVAVVDVSLPDGSGLDLVRRIVTLAPDTRILVLTMHARRQIADRAFDAGAHGYLLKESSGEFLVSALDRIMRNEQVLDPKLGGDPPADGCRDFPEGTPEPGQLSPREFEVFSLLAVGRSGKEIAAILGISPKTVDNHRANLMQKLCVTSVAELVRFAIRTGTIEA